MSLVDLFDAAAPTPPPRVLAGIAYAPPQWGHQLAEGRLVDTEGREVGPGCVAPLVVPATPRWVTVNGGDLCVVVSR